MTALTPWVAVLGVVGRFYGALVTYYNLDVKEGAPERAISGTFKTIKGLADVANVQSEPPLPQKVKTRPRAGFFVSADRSVEFCYLVFPHCNGPPQNAIMRSEPSITESAARDIMKSRRNANFDFK